MVLGIIEEFDGELEFECSSQEDSASESDIEYVDHSDGEKTYPNEQEMTKTATATKEKRYNQSLKKKAFSKSLGKLLINA